MIREDNILPKDWKLVKLEEVCDIISGKNQSKVINTNGKYPIYGSSGIFGYANEYLCNEGTTVVGRKGTINSPLYVNTKFWNVDTAFGLSPKEYYHKKNPRQTYYKNCAICNKAIVTKTKQQLYCGSLCPA